MAFGSQNRGVTSLRVAWATLDTSVYGIQPIHLAMRIVPNRHDEHMAPLQRLAEGFQTSQVTEHID